MHVVRAGKTPDFLPSDVRPAEQRMARQITPTVAVAMDRQLAESGKFDHSNEADRIETCHQARGPVSQQLIVPPAHLVEIAGQVEGIHDFLAGSFGMTVDDRHNGLNTEIKRTVRTVRLKFVVLYEINAGTTEIVDESRRLGGTQADTWFDNGPDQRPSLNTCQAPRSRDPKSRPRIGLRKFDRQPDIKKAQARDWFQLKQVASYRSEQVRQRGAKGIKRPRQGDVGRAGIELPARFSFALTARMALRPPPQARLA